MLQQVVRDTPLHRRVSRSSHYLRRLALGLALLAPLASVSAAPWMATGGSGHTQVLDGDGNVWGWGYNKYGTVGDGSTVNGEPHAQRTPRQAAISNVVSIASGQGHNVAVTSDGTVWSWGYGYLGHGAFEGRATPTQVFGVTNVKQVASGLFHTLALKQDGSVLAWGNNSRGSVGDGTNVHRESPVALALTGVRAIAANGHSLALKDDGTVWAWGQNDVGQAGGVAGQSHTTPRQVEGLTDVIAIAAGGGQSRDGHSVALKSDGTVWSWGAGIAMGTGSFNDAATPVQAVNVDKVVAIAAGNGFTLALREDGRVYTWGATEYSSLDSYVVDLLPRLVPGAENVHAIGAGWTHRILMLADGSVYTWGLNDVGQLGNPQSGNIVNTPVRVAGNNNAAFALTAEAPLKTNVDRLFNWAEWFYPHMFLPHTSSTERLGYYARCYSTGLCIGERDGRAYLYDGVTIRDVGGVDEMLELHAAPSGF
jgi:alpha-tubulin suppressor-like RCC1 family protein